MSIDFAKIEKKWQQRWSEARIHESNRDERKESFFLIFAYPGVTGYLHVGHMRGYSVSDSICRFKRMTGYNVLFPVGTHATGNGAIAFAKKVERGDERTLSILKENGCSDDQISKLSDPIEVVNFFNQVYLNDYWKRFGFLSDWRRFTCTIYPDYQKFIEWQMLKLYKKGLLIQKPYFAPSCPEHGPVAIDASETDIQRGGSAELVEYVALKFGFEDKFLVAGTLRPETIFGLTNFWVNPNARYVVVKVGNENWILSQEGVEKLRHQKDDVEVIEEISASRLIGAKCLAPHTRKEIPILPSELVDPAVGTGLVMSVPSDAPYDWMGLVDLVNHPEKLAAFNLTKEFVQNIKPIPIIRTPGWGPLPAVEICQKMNITELSDPKLEEATKEIYKSGFHRGTMAEAAGEYAGRQVEEAKAEIQQMLLDSGEADIFYDLSEEVICRCGKKVFIKKIPDQWFIDYANRELTDMSKQHARTMQIFPSEYYDNVQPILEWFRERACVRQGNWLGTRFPLDRKWIVEAIADSTLYPLYYLISIYVNDGRLKPENLTEEFFDYVFTDVGNIEEVARKTGVGVDLLDAIKRDIDYWYPLDINLGGKEHMTVHFPVFIMNHVGLLPKKYWPSGIIVNWYIVGGGGKISKSKGGAQPIPGAAERFGVDPMRLYYAHIASLYVDVEWNDEDIENYRTRMQKIDAHIDELLSLPGKKKERIDDWLLSELNNRIARIHDCMNQYDVRTFANEVYFEFPMDLRWYVRRGGGNRETILTALDAWVRLMTPITPHVAEELWERLGKTGFVSMERLPEPREEWRKPDAELEEEYLRSVSADISEILKVTGIVPKRIVLTVSPSWKNRVCSMVIESIESGVKDVGEVIKKAMAVPELSRERSEIPKFAKLMMTELQRTNKEQRSRMLIPLDEYETLESAKDFLRQEFNAEILVQKADSPEIYDPTCKAKSAKPRRPAIYAE
ncbi:MAG: leucine--tRNA ligase [Thermoplasmata archaeon]